MRDDREHTVNQPDLASLMSKPKGFDEVYASLLRKEEEFFDRIIERNKREGRRGPHEEQEGV